MDLGMPVEMQATHKTRAATTTGRLAKSVPTFIRICLRIYGASLVATGVVVPIAASVLTVIFYIAAPIPLLPPLPRNWSPGWYAILFGLLVTYIIWLVVALVCTPFATARGANSTAYRLLLNRLHQLRSLGFDRLGENPTRAELQQAGIIDENGIYNPLALREARSHYNDLRERLNGELARTGLDWVTGMGYVTAWDILHRAEEALIEVMPTRTVIKGAIDDQLAIQGSTMSSSDSLLDKLIQAVNDLDPMAAVYFKEHQPDGKTEKLLNKLVNVVNNHNRILLELLRSVKKIVPWIKFDALEQTDLSDLEAVKVATPDPETQATARVALREVHFTLNEFRDHLWEKLLRARNKLLGAIALTGFFTHMLLCITLLLLQTADRPAIIGATAFYMVGAIAGLFARLYGESRIGRAANDYGLSVARLITVPLLSGLAGVGGALITALLFSSFLGAPASGSMRTTLQQLFSLQDPRYLLAATIFGLAPNLIIITLQQRVEKYVTGLQSSKGASQE